MKQILFSLQPTSGMQTFRMQSTKVVDYHYIQKLKLIMER